MKLSNTLELNVINGQYWLYDSTRGMNLALWVATERDALVTALMYYQERLSSVEGELKALKNLVESFIDTVQGDEE